MLIDSTVFIDFLKGNKKAQEFLENSLTGLATSIIVVMEISAGLDNKKEINSFLSFLDQTNIKIVYLSEEISQIAFDLFINFKKQGLGIADSLIAATCLCEKQKIATHNIKHFSLVKNLNCLLPY